VFPVGAPSPVDRYPQHLRALLQVKACRGCEGRRRWHQGRAPDRRCPQVELQPQRGQGLPEVSQQLLDLRHRAQEDPIIQLPPVQEPPWGRVSKTAWMPAAKRKGKILLSVFFSRRRRDFLKTMLPGPGPPGLRDPESGRPMGLDTLLEGTVRVRVRVTWLRLGCLGIARSWYSNTEWLC